jgi:hypothetical protein
LPKQWQQLKTALTAKAKYEKLHEFQSIFSREFALKIAALKICVRQKWKLFSKFMYFNRNFV